MSVKSCILFSWKEKGNNYAKQIAEHIKIRERKNKEETLFDAWYSGGRGGADGNCSVV